VHEPTSVTAIGASIAAFQTTPIDWLAADREAAIGLGTGRQGVKIHRGQTRTRTEVPQLLAPAERAGGPEPKPLRGSIRLLESIGHGGLTEFPLRSGRRAGILSLGRKGEICIVEVKSGVPDFRSDHKWQDYLEWCDRFFFAADPEFPAETLSQDAGLFISDEYEAILVREPAATPLSAARRKALTLRFAHVAARRLAGRDDLVAVWDAG